MTIKTFFSCVLFLCATAGYSQNNTTPDNSIEAQFVEVIDKSNNYQKYKVIKRTKLAGLRKNILDSIELLENSIQQKDATIASQNNSITTLEASLSNTQNNLASQLKKKELFHFLELLLKKALITFYCFLL